MGSPRALRRRPRHLERAMALHVEEHVRRREHPRDDAHGERIAGRGHLLDLEVGRLDPVQGDENGEAAVLLARTPMRRGRAGRRRRSSGPPRQSPRLLAWTPRPRTRASTSSRSPQADPDPGAFVARRAAWRSQPQAPLLHPRGSRGAYPYPHAEAFPVVLARDPSSGLGCPRPGEARRAHTPAERDELPRGIQRHLR
jgi:hypothetical protein